MDIEDIENNDPNNQLEHPLNITDLCDDVLIKIFSYLDLYDKNIILPKVCRRFEKIPFLGIKEIDSNEFETEKWKFETNITKVFQNVGPNLKKLKINHKFGGRVGKEERASHINLMLNRVRKYCLKIDTLQIAPTAARNAHVKYLPNTLRKLVIKCFRGKLLDLRYLNNLDTLHLGLNTLIPDGIEWIKVKNRLKEMRLYLELGEFPNFSTINQLVSSISDNHSLHLSMCSDMFNDIPLIDFNVVHNTSNLQEISVIGYNTNGEDINKLLCFLAEKTSVTSIHIGSLTCDTSPIIHLKTIDLLIRCKALIEISFTYNDFIHSMISGYINRLQLKNIRLQYGFLAVDAGYYINLHVEKLIQLMTMILKFDNFSYYPKNREILFQSECSDEDQWKMFTKTFLHSAPEVSWSTQELLYLEIEAET